MAQTAQPYLLHALPGRVRLHLAGWPDDDQRRAETTLAALPGVQSAQANVLTHNVLVRFDPHVTDAPHLLAAARVLHAADGSGPAEAATQSGASGQERGVAHPARNVLADRPRVLQEGRGQAKRARIAVRGLDRDPAMAQRLVARLQRHPGVHAQASPLTGRPKQAADVPALRPGCAKR